MDVLDNNLNSQDLNSVDSQLVPDLDGVENFDDPPNGPRTVEFLGNKKVSLPYDYNGQSVDILMEVDVYGRLTVRVKKYIDYSSATMGGTVIKKMWVGLYYDKDLPCESKDDFAGILNSYLDKSNVIGRPRLEIPDAKLTDAYWGLYYDRVVLDMIPFGKNSSVTKSLPNTQTTGTHNNAAGNSGSSAWGFSSKFSKSDFFANLSAPSSRPDLGIDLVNDNGISFYKVTQDDIDQAADQGIALREYIRFKLAKMPEFAYLKDPVYDYKTKGVNVPSASIEEDFVTEGRLIPVPLSIDDRLIEFDQFRSYTAQAVLKMMDNPIYGNQISALVNESLGVFNPMKFMQLVNSMVVFARCESAAKTSNSNVGDFSLYRWEDGPENDYNVYSFSYYHILMLDWGKMAADKLGFTPGELYDPVNAGMWFLAFWCEKANTYDRDLEDIVMLDDDSDFVRIATKYNGPGAAASYSEKIKFHYGIVRAKTGF